MHEPLLYLTYYLTETFDKLEKEVMNTCRELQISLIHEKDNLIGRWRQNFNIKYWNLI